MVNQQDLITHFPIRRIQPYDGMVVTAETWETVHDYHRQQLRYHHLLSHGAGILIGLEVVASDPPDSSVYVQPGIAVDSAGRFIVLPELLAYDLGAAQGPLYLQLSYDESQPKTEDSSTTSGDATDVTLFVRSQYGLEAAGTPPDPSGPYLELARFYRQGTRAPIVNAADPLRPGVNEIDLRFRCSSGGASRPTARLAVCYAGKVTADAAQCHAQGAQQLARGLRQTGWQAWVDDAIELTPGSDLSSYALVYLVAQEAFQLTPAEMTLLYGYVQNGGTLLLEACHKGSAVEAITTTFLDMLSSFGMKVTDLSAGHPLLNEPNFFALPPVGFETGATASIKVGAGVIVSTFDYGCVWQGERRSQAASREEIRAAHEWGCNIMAYAVARRQQASRAL